MVAVTEGQLDLGPWEQVFYGEFDGKCRKHVLVKIIGGVAIGSTAPPFREKFAVDYISGGAN